MHSIFFGGISQYYYQNGALIQDNQVPFVKTISRVTRDANSNLTEYQLPVEMPSLKGAGAEFIPNLNLPHYSNKVFKLNEITQTSFMIGHILGGIQSSSLNPFSNNQTNFTSADNTVYEVWLNLNPLSNTAYQIDGSNPYDVIISPNPFEDVLNFSFNIDKVVRMNFIVSNSLGQILKKSDEVLLSANDNKVTLYTVDFNFKDKIFVTFIFDNKYYITKTIIKK
jgi:hypothetical protein